MSVNVTSKLPDGVVLKVPEGDEGQRNVESAGRKQQSWTNYANPVPLLLELGAPTHFVERIVGSKSEPERFIRIAESDTSSTTAAEARRRELQARNNTELSSAATSASLYVDALWEARRALMRDGVLGRLLVTDDVVCWPPPRLLDPIVRLRVEILSQSDQKDEAYYLQSSYLRHRIDVVGTGIHHLNVDWDSNRSRSLTQQKITPILYDITQAETVHYQQKGLEDTGLVEMKATDPLPQIGSGKRTKKQQKLDLEKKRRDENMKNRFGETAKETYQKGMSKNFDALNYKKEMLAGLEKDEDLRLTMTPAQSILKIYTLEFQKGEYRVFDLIAETIRKRKVAAGEKLSDDLAALSKDGWSMNKNVLQAFKEIIGIGWEQLINLHDFTRSLDIGGNFGFAGASPTDATTAMRCANGAVYSIPEFLAYERGGLDMTAASMMRLLSKNSCHRVRLRNGVYATRISFKRFFVIHKNCSVANTAESEQSEDEDDQNVDVDGGMDFLFNIGDDEEQVDTSVPHDQGQKKKLVGATAAPMSREELNSLKSLSSDELEEFEGKFRISLRETMERFGNVKVFFTNVPKMVSVKSEIDAFVENKFLDITTVGASDSHPEKKRSRTQLEEESVTKLERHEVKAECEFKKHHKLSDSTMVTEFVVDAYKNEVHSLGSIEAAALPDGYKPKSFVPGQDFVIIHGPRVLENYNPYSVEELYLTQELDRVSKDDASRKAIVQNLRASGVDAKKRVEALWKDWSLEDAINLVQHIFGENHNKLYRHTVTSHPEGKTIPEKVLTQALKKISHFDKKQGKYVLH